MRCFRMEGAEGSHAGEVVGCHREHEHLIDFFVFLVRSPGELTTTACSSCGTLWLGESFHILACAVATTAQASESDITAD
jgi:hypothetical protein